MRTANIHKHSSLLVSAIAAALLACHALAQQPSIDRVVAFGGSLTDSGNAFIWLSEPENRSCGAPSSVPPYDVLDDFLVPDGPYMKGGRGPGSGSVH